MTSSKRTGHKWPEVGANGPQRGNWLTVTLARATLRLFGWRITGHFPNEPRLVIIAAPHQSNWDWALAMLTLFALRLHMHWLAKHTLFQGVGGRFFRWLGGIPVDRGAATGIVAQAAEQIRAAPQFVLAIAPEGTRSEVKRFKTGFYHIALAAEVPILPVYVDYPGRELRLLDPIQPEADVPEAVAAIESMYARLRDS